MNREPAILKLLSVVNGICCVLFAAHHLNNTLYVPAPAGWWYLCAAALGLVYAFDMFMDSRKLQQPADRVAAFMLASSALFCLWRALPYLEYAGVYSIMRMCLFPVLLTLLYLAGIVWKRWYWLNPFREVIAAAIFGIALVYVQASHEPTAAAYALLFACSCLGNLLLGSWYDFEKDQQHGMAGLLHTTWFPARSADHMRSLYALLLLLPPALMKGIPYLWPAMEAPLNLPVYVFWIYVAQIGGYWVMRETEGSFRRYSLFRFAADWCLLFWLLL